jgi:uncharacterized alpha-E superfamily protein
MLLSRVANNLFWMGRYIERTEHLARFLNVQYFSSLDAPYPEQREWTMISILEMVGIQKKDSNLTDEEILVKVALDETNPFSILSSIYQGRENARSIRESISTELWEAINNYYLFIANYPVEVYKTRGLYDFTQKATNFCSIVRGRIHHTLLHDVGWMFIQLGIHLERAAQITRIITSKLDDIKHLQSFKLADTLEAQQINILLDCIEAKDMYRKYYNLTTNKRDTLEFLLFIPSFPRSVLNNLNLIHHYLKQINPQPAYSKDTIDFNVGKIINYFNYLVVDEIESDMSEFLDETLKKIHLISNLIVEEYFIY